MMAVCALAGCSLIGARLLGEALGVGAVPGVGAGTASSLATAASMESMAHIGAAVSPREAAVGIGAGVAGPGSGAGGDVEQKAVQVDPAASGQKVTLHVGQQLVVTVSPGWNVPRAFSVSSDLGSAVQPLRIESDASLPGSPASIAVFRAVRVGRT